MSARTVYATARGRRLGAILDEPAGMVHVWIAHGPMLGLYRLERFAGGRLTAKTLAALFAESAE